MDSSADNIEINQDELIMQQQRQIEKEVSKQKRYPFNNANCTNKVYNR